MCQVWGHRDRGVGAMLTVFTEQHGVDSTLSALLVSLKMQRADSFSAEKLSRGSWSHPHTESVISHDVAQLSH